MPRLAEFIRKNTEHILTEWETFARSLPAGETMDIAALRDHAKAMLNVIATDLEQPQTDRERSDKSQGRSDADESHSRSTDAKPEGAPTAAQEHGAGRAESGFTVDQMVAEFRALRATVIKLWMVQECQATAEDLEDMIRFNEAIDQAIAESITVYTKEVRQSKDRFLAILGHDLRTPLGAIITSTRFMLDTGSLVEPHLALVTRVERSARRMNRMVTDLLEFTRTRFGDSMPIAPADMDLEQVIRNVASEVSASYSTVNLTVAISGDLRGEWDSERLTQAVTNLASNAVHHGDTSRPIAITGARTRDGVVVSVHNHGPTIGLEEMAHLFDSTKEGVADETRDRGHLGLGLFIVDRIVQAHGGRIEVESTETAGTTFRIHLPTAA